MSNQEITLADTEKLDKNSISPPLADPILKLIFESVHTGGLAVESLLNSTLLNSGDPPIAEVVSVTPQKIAQGEGERSYRY